MTELERLAKEIFFECYRGGEPVTEEEALEMARAEINAKSVKRYEQAEKPRKKSTKERKVDETKAKLMDRLIVAIENFGGTVTSTETETALHFNLDGTQYTIKLIKHRPPK